MIEPTLYTGTHLPAWLWSGQADFHLFVSHRRLAGYRTLRPARVQWALDSGGFSELSLFGGWRTGPREYAEAVARYDEQIGRLEWAAPQDWMFEPHITAKTGLTVPEHQARTVANFVELTGLWPQLADSESPFMPVLQAAPGDAEGYLECARLYEDAGVHLAGYPVVGVGTVCRIQDTALIGRVARGLQPLDLALHWFGVKLSGLPEIWPPQERSDSLTSFDSMAWSYDARRAAPLPGCTGHENCANCPAAARRWRGRILATVAALERRGWQGELFTPAGEQPSSEASISPSRARGRALLSHAPTPGCATSYAMSPAPERSPHPAGLSLSRQHDDVTFVMERVREAVETPGELSGQHGAIHDIQHHGGRGADDDAASCRKAGWSMRDAARHLADALAARAR